MMNNRYSAFAHYYDDYTASFDTKRWCRYLKKISGLARLKNQMILDLGCGTGTLSMLFAKKGAQVHGVDLSEEMLTIADQKAYSAGIPLRLIHADIAEYESNEPYDFIYSACDTVNYLTAEALRNLLGHIVSMMKPNAIFTFDILNCAVFSDQNCCQSYKNGKVCFSFCRRRDGDRLLTELEISDGGRTFAESHTQYLFSVETVRKFAEEAGLKWVASYEIFTELSPKSDSEKYQIVLQKTEKYRN